MNIQNLEMEFQIEERAVAEGAEDRFFRICAFHLAEAGQRRMEEAAFGVREHLRNKMDICAAVRFYDEPLLAEDTLQLNDASLRCGAFGRIPGEAVKGTFVYLLTIGETDIEGEKDIMTELYHDIWGTAYVESAMAVLRKDCLEGLLDAGLYLSESFGPGYFGMNMDQGKLLFELVDGTSIGVEQKASGLLTPEKSCLGLVLVYDRDDIKMPRVCEKCLGTRGGCRFCEKRV